MLRNEVMAVARVFVLILGMSICALGQTTLCTTDDTFKIPSPTLILVHCNEDISGIYGTVQLYSADNPAPIGKGSVSAYKTEIHWLLVNFASPDSPTTTLVAGASYKLALDLTAPGNAASVRSKLDFSLDNTAKLSLTDVVGGKTTLTFGSHLGFTAGPGSICTFQIESFERANSELQGDCFIPAALPLNISADQLVRQVQTPEDVGSISVTLSNNRSEQVLLLKVPGLKDIYAKDVKIDSKAQLSVGKAPTNKDAADYYINFNHAAGTGSKPAWTLTAKIAPPLGRLHAGFQFLPLLSADIGHNQISGIKYADTINLGATLRRVYQPGGILHGLVFLPGAKYETDREFDRHNLLASPDAQLYFAHLYKPRQRGTLEKFAKELQVANCKIPRPGDATVPADCKPIPWTMDNTKPVLMGYALDFHTGLEVGSALKDTTVTASVGKATQALPAYPIARLVPAVHALLEVGRFSVDSVLTGRYLAVTENTIFEAPDHTLSLQHIDGWRAFGVITANYNLDSVGHVGLTISYKDGFSPPRFLRTNTVQSGITFKY
jgi:hypothetical protein